MIVFAEPAIVHRVTYSGNDVIAKNSKFAPGYVDDRGYVPVEWWIMSFTEAGNELKKENEGVTVLKLDGKRTLLSRLSLEQKKRLFGNYHSKWPLVKPVLLKPRQNRASLSC